MFSKKQKNKLSPKSYRLKANHGFTLLELVLSMAMIAILTGSAIQIARFSDTHKSLTLAADEIKAVIRSAQSSALSVPNPENRHVCGFGVYFGEHGNLGQNDEYEMFYTHVAGGDFVLNPKTCETQASYRNGSATTYVSIPGERHALPAGVTLDGSTVDKTIFFRVPYGDVYDENGAELTADETFTIESGANSKVITVTSSGQVE